MYLADDGRDSNTVLPRLHGKISYRSKLRLIAEQRISTPVVGCVPFTFRNRDPLGTTRLRLCMCRSHNIFLSSRHYIGERIVCERVRSSRQIGRKRLTIRFEVTLQDQQNLNNSYAKKPGNGIQRHMSEERFTERKTDVSNATRRLIEAVKQPERDILRDAVIQRFEFSFELVWKALKLYLERQGHECGGLRPTLKKAFTEGIINTPEEGDIWLQMLEDRNLTTHAYDQELAIRIYQHIVDSYAELLGRMVDKIQELAWD